MSGVGLRASHNLIHDHPHCAILFGGNEHLIEFNEIHHIALETGDVGAIYTGRDWTCRGNRIRHNFIHHTGGVGMGSMGVYMDDCVSGTEVFGNVFYKVHWAMFIGGGRDHRVENNVFVDCDPAVRMDGRGLDKSPVWFNMVYDYMKKQLAAVPQELYRSRYPAIADLDRYYANTDGVPPENNVVARNVCVGKWLEVGWHAEEKCSSWSTISSATTPASWRPTRWISASNRTRHHCSRVSRTSPATRLGRKRGQNYFLARPCRLAGCAQSAR